MTVAGADGSSRRRRWGLSLLGVALVVAAFAGLSLGAVAIPVGSVVEVLVDRLRGVAPPGTLADSVVWGIRLPRVLMAAVAGSGLAVCGAVLQGALRNPLADPHLLGIGPGAAIGGVLGSALGGIQGSIAGGVAAGVITSLVVRSLARRAEADENRLVLSGVALGVGLSAWAGFLVFGLDRGAVPPLEFWLLGSMGGTTWRGMATTAVLVAIGGAVSWGMRRALDLLLLGHGAAWNLGLDVEMTTTLIFIVVGAVVGATVGAIGVVVFAGLLVPHLMRAVSGPSHRHLLPASALGGALFLMVADLLARLLFSPIELPVGLVTSVIGAPVFLTLLGRGNRG